MHNHSCFPVITTIIINTHLIKMSIQAIENLEKGIRCCKIEGYRIYTKQAIYQSYIYKNKGVLRLLSRLLKMAATYSPTNAVPSARLSLTTLFGMGRGGTSAL